MSTRLRVGLIGAGIIAQVMHLHNLRELADRYEITAICDVSSDNADNNAARYGIPHSYTDWQQMIDDAPIDAVFVLTSGSHAPMAIAAARAGKHVLVEKPMAFSAAEGIAMRDAAREAGVALMVAYPKRYDPAYERFVTDAQAIENPRLMRVTTFEAPFLPYIRHYTLAPIPQIPADTIASLKASLQDDITRALGDVEPTLRRTYHEILLDTLVHELNTVRGIYGEPTSLDFVKQGEGSLTVILDFDGLEVAIHWLDLPGITRYGMEFAAYGPLGRSTLTFPSPFLRNAPAEIESVSGEVGAAGSAVAREIVSYESGFLRELEEFHRCAIDGSEPLTSADDAIADLAICEAIIRFLQTGERVANPSVPLMAVNA